MPQSPQVTPVAGSDPAAASQRTYAFDLMWQAPNGERFDGRFEHRCPSVGEAVTIEAAHLARLGGAAVKDTVNEMALMIEHLEVTLRRRPAWAQPVADIPHIELLRAVAEEAAAHLGRFHGTDDSRRDSQS